MIEYFQHDTDGNIVRTGNAATAEEIIHDPTLTTRFGTVNSATDYWDGAAVATYDSATLARRAAHPGLPGFRWIGGYWVDQRPLDDAKVNKWQEIKRARTAAEFGTFNVSGYTFDCDARSQANILAAAQAAIEARTAGQPFNVTWTLADGTDVVLGRAQMIAVATALQAYTNTVYSRARTLKAAIAAATSKAELDAVIW